MINYVVLLEGLLLERGKVFNGEPETIRKFYPGVFDFLVGWGKCDD
jgi:hypothetical protein